MCASVAALNAAPPGQCVPPSAPETTAVALPPGGNFRHMGHDHLIEWLNTERVIFEQSAAASMLRWDQRGPVPFLSPDKNVAARMWQFRYVALRAEAEYPHRFERSDVKVAVRPVDHCNDYQPRMPAESTDDPWPIKTRVWVRDTEVEIIWPEIESNRSGYPAGVLSRGDAEHMATIYDRRQCPSFFGGRPGGIWGLHLLEAEVFRQIKEWKNALLRQRKKLRRDDRRRRVRDEERLR